MWHELLSLQAGAESICCCYCYDYNYYIQLHGELRKATLSARLWESKQHPAALREVADYQGAVPSVPCQI